MTKLNQFLQEPNVPIFLEDILVTHINDRRLEGPRAAQVVLRLSQRVRLLIESDSFPIGILDDLVNMPFFVIKVKDKRDIKVVFRRSSWNKCSLGLYESPCTVLRPDAKINSISFSVLNFLRFSGRKDKWIDSERLGATELIHDNLQISLTQAADFHELEKISKHTNGYGVTHTGVIECRDGGTFSVKEAECILRGLRAFLSFARGAGCGLMFVKAAYPDGGQAFLEWGSAHGDPWQNGHDTWLPVTPDGAENLSQAFSGFWTLYNNQEWRDVLLRIINYYIYGKTSLFDVGIILIQAALETLCFKISDSKNQGPMGEFLSKSMKDIGLCTAIPSSCKNLDAFFKDCSRVDGDGAKAIVELRNDLIHPKRIHDDNAEAQMDAWHLGHWYIELILLKKFNYHGRYTNRMAIAGENLFEKVPWAK